MMIVENMMQSELNMNIECSFRSPCSSPPSPCSESEIPASPTAAAEIEYMNRLKEDQWRVRGGEREREREGIYIQSNL